jgi:hypothetical protein
MTKAKVTATGSKKTEDDGVRISTFSVVRNGPLRRAINEALDTLPHPSSLIPGKTKMTVELCEDSQIRINYEVGYKDPRRHTASTPATSGNR